MDQSDLCRHFGAPRRSRSLPWLKLFRKCRAKIACGCLFSVRTRVTLRAAGVGEKILREIVDCAVIHSLMAPCVGEVVRWINRTECARIYIFTRAQNSLGSILPIETRQFNEIYVFNEIWSHASIERLDRLKSPRAP